MFSRRYLVNSCRTPKKLSFNVSLHLPLTDQSSPFATQMKIKYAKEYSIRKTGIKVEATQLDEINICETFKTIGNGQLESIQKRLARLSGKKIPMFRNALLIIYFSPHFRFGHQIFAFWEPYGWTSRAFWRSNITCNQKYCFQQEPLDCLHLMLLSGNWFSICLCNSEESYWWELLN